MSWLFGIRKDPSLDQTMTGLPPPPAAPPLDASGGSSDSRGGATGGGGGKGSSDDGEGSAATYRFDSTALERAAKAARELELSPNAKQILELTKMQERNKEMDYLAKVKEYEAHIENAKSEQIRVQHEERRKTIAEETKHNQQRAQYQDQLARKRYEDQLIQQQKANEENLRRQEESLAKQEAMKRATIEKELEMREKSDLKRIEAEVKARGKVERENQDLYLEQIRLKATEQRTSNLELLKTAASTFGAGFNSFISDWSKLTAAVGGITLLYVGYFTAKRGTKIAADHVRAHLMRPALIKEFHGFTLMDCFKHPVQTIRRLMAKSGDTLQGVVLNPKLEERLSMFTLATANTKKNRGVYMNMLLYGPPGTGKTLFARRLAQHCGMNCAIMSGADIAPMGRDGVIAIHRLFDYASKYRRGLLVFIDEADAFLRKRSAERMSQSMRASLNAFLARTGDKSDKYMLVLASNTPEQLDKAINDRIHAVVEFDLPGLEERERLVRLYFDKYILIPATEGKRKLKVENFDYSEMCSEIAKLTSGFSGRGISNMAAIWQASAFVSEDGVLTRKMIMDIVQQAVKEHRKKKEWESGIELKKWAPGLSPLEESVQESTDSTDKSHKDESGS